MQEQCNAIASTKCRLLLIPSDPDSEWALRKASKFAKIEPDRESGERGLLHLVGALLADGEDGDGVAGGEELLGEVEADDGMPAAVGVDDEHLLLLGGGGGIIHREGGGGGRVGSGARLEEERREGGGGGGDGDGEGERRRGAREREEARRRMMMRRGGGGERRWRGREERGG